MSFFKRFPKLRYDVDGSGSQQEIVDLFKRVVFTEKVKNAVSGFQRVNNYNQSFPDQLAHELYDDPTKHWQILLLNEIINPFYDWGLPSRTLESYTAAKYPGSTFFVSFDETSTSSSSSGSITSSSSSKSSSSTAVENTSFSSSSGSSSSSSVTISSSSSTENSTSSSSESSSSSSSSSVTASSSSSSSSKSSSSTQAENSSSSSQSSSSIDDSFSSVSSSSAPPDNSSSSSQSTWTKTSSSSDSLDSSSSSENPALQFVAGETVSFSSGGTGSVHSWDPTYKRLVVDSISLTDSEIQALDGDTITGSSSTAEATIERVVLDSRDAVHHFEGTITDDEGDTLFEKVWLDPRDYIHTYIFSNSQTNVVTNLEYEVVQNDERNNLLFVNNRFTDTISRELNKLLG